MGVSRRKFAEMRGVTEAAVRAAISSGRITVEPDDTIDPDKANEQWDRQTDPSKQRGPHANALRVETQAGTARAAATKPVPKAAIDAVNATLEGEGGAAASGGGSGEVSFLRARMANEVLKAQTARVRLEKMKGELVDRSKATATVFDLARRERDAWLNWPPRVAANMAAEIGIDPHLLEQTLDRYLRLHLADMAEVKIDLR